MTNIFETRCLQHLNQSACVTKCASHASKALVSSALGFAPGVRVGCMECIEPLNTCMIFWEVATMQVIWKGENKPHLSNAEPYQ